MESPGGRGRLLVLAALFIGCGVVLAGRLYQVQVLEHDRFRALATEEHRRTIPIVPKRGALLDRDGHPLAMSVLYDSVFAVGNQVKDVPEAAAKLSPILEIPAEELQARLDPDGQHPVLLKARLPAATAAQVLDLALTGVYLEQAPAREYPEGSIAAQLLGFVGTEFHGMAGLEASLDETLAGQQGTIESEWDTTDREIALARRVVQRAMPGSDVVLTIDRYVQRQAERILGAAVVESKATGGVILIMEPSTGELLAMASHPTYSLTEEEIYKPEYESLYKPTWVTDQYEPGSVMKVVTMSAGIDSGAVGPNSTVDDTGYVTIDGVVLHNWDGYAHGPSTMTEVLIHSSNVGTQYVSARLGPQRFYDALYAFGFGQVTDVGLPGETPGLVRDASSEGWTRIDLATNAYGQGVAVTPLQMLTAVSAIGNDGLLMRPMLVKETRGPDGQVFEPQAIRQAVSADAARTVRQMMVEVFEQPALETSHIPGYEIAAKTGTADVATTLGYGSGKTYASIVALIPAETPRLAILIRLDGPEKIYGGVVAAPVLKRLAEDLLPYQRIPPTLAIQLADSD